MPDIISTTLRQVTTLVNEDRVRGKALGADGFFARVQNLVIDAFDTADILHPEVSRAGDRLSLEWRDDRRSLTVTLGGAAHYAVTETGANGDVVGTVEGMGRPNPDDLRARVVALTEEVRAEESVRARAAAERFNRVAIIEALTAALWDRGNDVRSWPADEAAAYREKRFAEGRDAARAIVIGKAADAVLAAIGKQKLES